MRKMSLTRESSGGPEKVVVLGLDVVVTVVLLLLVLLLLLLLPGTERGAPAAGSKNAYRWREGS